MPVDDRLLVCRRVVDHLVGFLHLAQRFFIGESENRLPRGHGPLNVDGPGFVPARDFGLESRLMKPDLEVAELQYGYPMCFA